MSAPGLRWPLVVTQLYSGGEMCRKSAGGDRAVNVEQAPVSGGPRSTDDIGSVAFRGPGADLCGTPSVCLRKRPAAVAGGDDDDDDDDGVDMIFLWTLILTLFR